LNSAGFLKEFPHVFIVCVAIDPKLTQLRPIVTLLTSLGQENLINCQLESIVDHPWNELFQDSRGFIQTRVRVDFDQPCFELAVDQEIKSKNFKC
jgi:hypothetical protein